MHENNCHRQHYNRKMKLSASLDAAWLGDCLKHRTSQKKGEINKFKASAVANYI